MFPRPTQINFIKPGINLSSIPDIPAIKFNPINNLKNLTEEFDSSVDPRYYKKYIPNADFNFFLNLLKENALIIILIVLDGMWFAYRCSKTYATVVQLLHGFPHVIDVDEVSAKIKEKERQATDKSNVKNIISCALEIMAAIS